MVMYVAIMMCDLKFTYSHKHLDNWELIQVLHRAIYKQNKLET